MQFIKANFKDFKNRKVKYDKNKIKIVCNDSSFLFLKYIWSMFEKYFIKQQCNTKLILLILEVLTAFCTCLPKLLVCDCITRLDTYIASIHLLSQINFIPKNIFLSNFKSKCFFINFEHLHARQLQRILYLIQVIIIQFYSLHG